MNYYDLPGLRIEDQPVRDTPPVAPVAAPFTAEEVEELAAWMDGSPFRQRTMDTVPMLRYLAALLRQQEGK
jgi:hypothetical protein